MQDARYMFQETGGRRGELLDKVEIVSPVDNRKTGRRVGGFQTLKTLTGSLN